MPSDTPSLYAIVYDNGEPYGRGFVVKDRHSGAVAPSGTLQAPGSHREVALPHGEAMALMAHLRAQHPESYTWQLVRALAPCPHCGRELWTNDMDACYPNNREMTSWRVGCNEHDGGCGFEVRGPTREEAVLTWNSTPAPATALARMARRPSGNTPT